MHEKGERGEQEGSRGHPGVQKMRCPVHRTRNAQTFQIGNDGFSLTFKLATIEAGKIVCLERLETLCVVAYNTSIEAYRNILIKRTIFH